MKTTNLAFIFVFGMSLFFFSPSVMGNMTMVQVSPALTSVYSPNNTFKVNISISQVTDLAAWDFKLYYPANLLNASDIAEGSFLKLGGSTAFIRENFTDHYNSTYGRIWCVCTLIGQGPGVSGSGTLATITFKAKAGGNATLHLSDTKLLDSKMPSNYISHSDQDGLVQIFISDIAILDLYPQCHQTLIGTKNRNTVTDPVRFNVTVANLGSLPATIKNITVYMTSIINVTYNVYLPVGAFKTITFPWLTSASFFGNYTLWAIAYPLNGDINMTNNSFVYGKVQCTIMGDTTRDGRVNVLDLINVGRVMFTKIGDPGYNPNFDIKTDGTVNVLDLIVCAQHLGQHYP